METSDNTVKAATVSGPAASKTTASATRYLLVCSRFTALCFTAVSLTLFVQFHSR